MSLIRKDGTIHSETRARYQCHYNTQHPGEYDGQSGYGVSKLDKIVKAVHVRRDYEIDIEFNVSFEEFQDLYLAKGVQV